LFIIIAYCVAICCVAMLKECVSLVSALFQATVVQSVGSTGPKLNSCNRLLTTCLQYLRGKFVGIIILAILIHTYLDNEMKKKEIIYQYVILKKEIKEFLYCIFQISQMQHDGFKIQNTQK